MMTLALNRDRSAIAVSFPYDDLLVFKIKNVTGRRWSKPEKCWLVPLCQESYDALRTLFSDQDMSIASELQEYLAGQKKQLQEVVDAKALQVPADLPGDVHYHTQPFAHQKKALALCLMRRAFALFMEMGTGKTKVILDLLGYLAPASRRAGSVAVVVCPLSVTENWVREAGIHQPGLRVVALRGSSADKIRHLHEARATGVDAVVINYESAWRIENALADLKISALILDESTRIKTRSTQQAKALVRLGGKADRKYILTGTPMPNGPLELFNQIRFLDPTLFGASFYAFRDRYAVMGGFKGYQVIGWKNLSELSHKLAGISYRVKKSECLDLPAKLYKEYRLDMTEQQREVYDKMAEQLITEINGKEISVNVVLAKIAKLRQITSGFAYDGVTALDLKTNPKLNQLAETLGPILREGHKVVIWTSFRHEMEIIQWMLNEKLFGTHRYVCLSGEVSATMRMQYINEFQTDPDVRIFIGQQRAGGLGITLTAADYCIYFSNDFSPEIRLQSEDRLHRYGQKNTVTYIDLIMRNSIDGTIQRMLKNKQELSKTVVEQNLKGVLYGEAEF